MYQNIVLHIPHGSEYIPEQVGNHQSPALCLLRTNSFHLIDYYTQPLFAPSVPKQAIKTLCAHNHRMLVDMERLPNDPLEPNGFGIVSQWAINWLGEDYRQVALEQYRAYHEEATKCLNMLKNPLLIDCHSFSSKPTPLCPIPHDVDICIGWNEDETCPDRMLLKLVAAYFKDCGYAIGINKPFSNSKTFPGTFGYHSMMIEINKRCYMNEETLEKTPNFTNLHNQLQRLYEILLGNK
jgi:N-formylglutamate amidohydrolase